MICVKKALQEKKILFLFNLLNTLLHFSLKHFKLFCKCLTHIAIGCFAEFCTFKVERTNRIEHVFESNQTLHINIRIKAKIMYKCLQNLKFLWFAVSSLAELLMTTV